MLSRIAERVSIRKPFADRGNTKPGGTHSGAADATACLAKARATGLKAVLALSLALGGIGMTGPANATTAHLVAQKAIHAPAGFKGLCARYTWVCTSTGQSSLSAANELALAQTINRAVNKQVRQIEDTQQYGKAEHWALPTRRGGDCEDLVLLKKKMLIERGVPSQDLLIATVLDRKMGSHAVLVFRTAKGDLILDSLTDKIVPWDKTGYTFLKLQNPKKLSKWDAILAGGVIKDRPTASR